MVSFQCENCGDVLTKKKLDAHANKCRNTSFTCLDCHKQFYGASYKSHTSCISEAEKYQGALYQEKKPKPKMNRQPRVEDFEAADTPPHKKSVTFEVPPPAPSPPPAAAAPAINVFDYMVPDDPQPGSPSSSDSSSYDSDDSDTDHGKSPSPQAQRSLPAPPTHSTSATSTSTQQPPGHPPAPPAYQYAYPQPPPQGYAYPPQPTYWYPQPPSQTHPQLPSATAKSPLHTPAPTHATNTPSLSRSESAKKRKRSPTRSEAQAPSKQDGAVLHSGLTGGLDKMLAVPTNTSAQPSPLSPKKRHKRSAEETAGTSHSRPESRREDRDEGRERKQKSSHHTSTTATALVSTNKDRALTSTRRPISHTSNYSSHSHHRSKHQRPNTSHSEFFLSLIDKDHKSHKGQSIWGALKMFHEGAESTAPAKTGQTDEEVRRVEEKRLLKGLRCKINKQGEVVLFSRPEAEED